MTSRRAIGSMAGEAAGGGGIAVVASEYICISCWTSFSGTAGSGDITCPHCGYVQPGQDGAAAAPKAKPAAAEPADMDMTMQDMRMPWAEGGPPTKRKGGKLEPMSFDDLAELEQLLSNDGGKKGSGVRMVDASAAAETAEEAPPSTATRRDPEQIWRLKTDAGLTYSFYSVDALQAWGKGLSGQKNRLVSLDGVAWKAYDQFEQQLSAGTSAEEAIANTATARPPGVGTTSSTPPPPASRASKAGSATSPPAAPARRGTVAQMRAASTPTTTTSERRRTTTGQNALMDALMEAEAEPGASAPRSPSGSRRTSGSTVSAIQRKAGSDSWGLRVAMMAGGVLVGGLGVYFGMYLAGFYDLKLPF